LQGKRHVFAPERKATRIIIALKNCRYTTYLGGTAPGTAPPGGQDRWILGAESVESIPYEDALGFRCAASR